MVPSTETSDKIKVGDKFFMFDIDRRRYSKSRSRPDYRHHFYEVTIEGETRASWIVGKGYNETKVPKKDPFNKLNNCSPRLYTAHHVDGDCWVNLNKYKLIDLILSINDPDVLKEIAGLLNHKDVSEVEN